MPEISRLRTISALSIVRASAISLARRSDEIDCMSCGSSRSARTTSAVMVTPGAASASRLAYPGLPLASTVSN